MSRKINKTDIRPFTRQFYRGNGWCLALAVVETVLSVASSLMVAWLIQQITDLIAGSGAGFSLTQLLVMSVLCLALVCGGFLLDYLAKPRFITRGIAQYKEYVFRELTRKNISAFSGENSARYISALSNDAATVETGYLGNIFTVMENTLLFSGALVMMLWYSPLLTLISVALSLLPVLASFAAGSRAAQAQKTVSDKNEIYLSTLKDTLAGFSVIKSFQAEARICRIFRENVQQLADAKCRKRKISVVVQMLGTLAGYIAQMGVFLIGAYLALSGKGVTVGTVMVFVQMMNYVLSPIGTIPNALAEMSAAKALIQKLAEALPENVRTIGDAAPVELKEGIRIRNVSFAYDPEKPVLQNVDFQFDAGKSYAIVGASGSGKSTLLNLLMAAYPDYSGAICYDDRPLEEISSASLYEMVSVVQQNVFIFNASIQNNITMFADFPKAEVDRAIQLSGLGALIVQRGEDYLCGENGSGLSGGEKQRISIARSLLKKAQVLLVDEATAALDAQTAFQVAGAIADLQGLTRIVVTHALDENLLQRYDCILTLKNGCIAESGTFHDLMTQKGYFYSLFTVSQ